MPAPDIIPIGSTFNRLTIIQEDYSGKKRRVICHCSCGKEKSIDWYYVKKGIVKSCGCLDQERKTTHNETGSRLYVIYRNILKRINNPDDPNYAHYGGRGISICKEWNTYEAFREWAYKTDYKDNLTIERRDVNGNYEPNNCYWADMSTQQSNRRKRKNTINKLTGIHPLPNGKWRAIVEWQGKKIMDKGTYPSQEDALEARNKFIIQNELPHIIQ